MTPRELEEYKALRATIRERGTVRVWVFIAGILGWAALVIATAALAALPVATLLPLLVLASTFDAVFALHTGVERIGRYIQVNFEGPALPADAGQSSPSEGGWEHAAMAYGKTFGAGLGVDPVFAPVFVGAAVLNFVPVILAEPVALEVAVIGGIHVLFVIRVLIARQRASRQRASDLERFQKLKA
jgi:hypothetical protein